jgi:hypothetical protein
MAAGAMRACRRRGAASAAPHLPRLKAGRAHGVRIAAERPGARVAAAAAAAAAAAPGLGRRPSYAAVQARHHRAQRVGTQQRLRSARRPRVSIQRGRALPGCASGLRLQVAGALG